MFFIAMGSSLGGITRYYISKFFQNLTNSSFPAGTIIVNLIGCFLIGILYSLFDRGNLMNTHVRLFLVVGFCGGFTTFSTFMGDNFQLIRVDNLFVDSLYLAGSIIGGYLLLYIGYTLIKML